VSALEPVRRSQLVKAASPADVYAVVVDFEAYPRLFPELTAVKILARDGRRTRVEFRAKIVLPVRYVLDLVCDEESHTVDWTYVEGEVVTSSVGGWRFVPEGEGTRVDYSVALEVKAPLPGFVLRKVTDGLVSLSLPAMFAALEREVAARRVPR
jgi:ribosome-associated toxin RatA of RatAB toxin-antitoxin module